MTVTPSTSVQTSDTRVLDAPVDEAVRRRVAAMEPEGRPERPRGVLQKVPGSPLKARAEQMALGAFIAVPLLCVVAAVPLLWGHGIGWVDIVLAIVFYAITGHGITVGFHRYLTHGSFKANRGLRIGLAIAGSMAIEGPVTRWVADHRRHHAYSDKDGDPHSPWRYGESVGALTKGLWHAHIGWLFDIEQTDQQRFVPDLLADPDIRWVDRLFPLWVAVSLLAPALLGGLITWSVTGALTAFFWASILRVGLLHHVTWSINSICHAMGSRPYASRDKSGNVRWLAFLSMGESWHNLHHADPTCARHGASRGQFDSSGDLIWVFEKLGWATDVRWPDQARLERRLVRADDSAAA